MSAEEPEEQRIGRLVVRAASRDGASDYRHPARVPVLELRCEAGGRGPIRSGAAVALAAVLATVLLAFAVVVRSWPAVGAVSVAVGALGWLVLAGRSGRLAAIVRLTKDELRVIAPGRAARVPLSDVESVALGQDRDALRTLFARVKGAGRVLLLDGLTPEEAALALERLGELVARR